MCIRDRVYSVRGWLETGLISASHIYLLDLQTALPAGSMRCKSGRVSVASAAIRVRLDGEGIVIASVVCFGFVGL